MRDLPIGVAADERNAKVLKPIGDVGGGRRGLEREQRGKHRGNIAYHFHSLTYLNGEPLDVISHIDLLTTC